MVKLHTTAELARFLWIEVYFPQLWLLFLSILYVPGLLRCRSITCSKWGTCTSVVVWLGQREKSHGVCNGLLVFDVEGCRGLSF